MKNESGFSSWFRGAGWVVLLIALLQFGLHLWTNAHDNFFRDELYYMSAAQHLDFGYVEYPPFVALAAAFSRAVFGESVVGMRLLPAIASALIILLTAGMASMLGGRLWSQIVAAVAAGFDAVFVGGAGLLSMDPFDQLWWTLAAWILVRLIQSGRRRLWLAFGLVIGVGLNTKLTIAFFLVAVMLGLLLSASRRLLFDRWLLLGGGAALILVLPYLIWQAQHGMPVVEYTGQYAGGKTFQASPSEFLLQQVLTHNPLSLPLWLGGLCFLFFTQAGKPYRGLGWAYIFLLLFFMLQKTKFYWLAPAYPALFAAGAVALEQLVALGARTRWIPAAYAAVLTASGLMLIPYAIPILPPESFIQFNAALGGTGVEASKQENLTASELPQNYADRYGWKEMVAAIGEAYNTLTPEEKAATCILTTNYGQAGAVDFYGRQLGLPRAITGHNSFYLWGPQGCTGEVVISIGRPLHDLNDSFESVRAGPAWSCRYCMPYENGAPIYIARGLKFPMDEAWPTVKHFD